MKKSLVFLILILLVKSARTQNVGIGTSVPAYKFQVHDGSSANIFMNLTNSTTGVSVSDGLLIGISSNSAIVANLENGNLRLGTNNFTRVLIDETGNVGIGNLAPAYKLDVNGNMNLTGTLRINGSPGLSGQVLTSNGSSDPIWKESSFGNNTRFALSFSETSGAAGITTFPVTTIYNLNATDITIAANSFTINKTGLYHFDYFLSFTATSATRPSISAFLSGAPTGYSLFLLGLEPVMSQNSAGTYRGNWHFGMDIHIIAPATISLRREFDDLTGSNAVSTGKFMGHLISE